MKPLDNTMRAIGLLDIIYVLLVAVRPWLGTGFPPLIRPEADYGLPDPQWLLVALLLFYLTVLPCGLGLLLRCRTGAWLNWLLYPLRIVLVMPTLFPVTALLDYMGMARSAVIVLLAGESLRIFLVQRWLGTPTRKALRRILLTAGILLVVVGTM